MQIGALTVVHYGYRFIMCIDNKYNTNVLPGYYIQYNMGMIFIINSKLYCVPITYINQ